METRPQQQDVTKTGIMTLATKWMVTLPMFATLMAFVTTQEFFGNSLWEALRATGDSASK